MSSPRVPTPAHRPRNPRSRSPRRAAARSVTPTQSSAAPGARGARGARGERGERRERAPGSVWLCVPGPHEPDPGPPIWARRTVEAFSQAGDRVIVRSHGAHASLPGEVAALIGAATALGRHPLALLPTPASATRTRALLTATTPTPTGPAVPAGSGAGITGAVAAATPHEAPAGTSTATPAAMSTAAASTAATRAGVATAAAGVATAASPGGAVTAATPTGPVAGAPATASPTGSAGPAAGPVVGVSRRRPARASGAALVVVLAGPVTSGARGARRPIPSRALRAWSAALRPGGILAVLTPPQIGHRRWGPPPGGIVATAQDIGLAYTAHIVLVHTPVRDGQLQRPDSPRRPHAPFWTVHTDLFALRREPLDPVDTLTPTGEQTEQTDRVDAGPEPVTTPIPLHPPDDPARGPEGVSGEATGEWGASA